MAFVESIRKSYWRLEDLLIARTILSGCVATAALLFASQADVDGYGWTVTLPAVVVFLSNLPFFLFAFRRHRWAVSWGTVLVDSLFVTFLVYNTSGAGSSLAIFYLWPIVAASLLLGARASYLAAGLCGSLYLGFAVLQAAGWQPQDLLAGQGISSVDGLDAVLVRVSAFLLIALLSGMLSNALLRSNAELLDAKESLERELDRVKLSNRRLSILDEMSRALGRLHDLDILLPRALTRLATFVGVDSGMVTLISGEFGEPRIAARLNVEEAGALALFAAALPPYVDEIREFVVGQDAEDGRYGRTLRALDRQGFSDFLAAPLRVGDEYLGTLYLFTRPGQRFKRSDVTLLHSLCNQLAIAVKNVLFTQELTEANEELLHLDQLKSDFLATMSHELRTPLTSIIGYSDLLLSGMTGDITERQRGFLRSILNSGETLLDLINDILDLTKIEAGKLELSLEPTELRSVLGSVLSTLKPRAKEKRIRISTFLPAQLPPLLADPAKLGQILTNLVTNAVKYTQEGGSVGIEARTLPDGEVEVRVTDSGIGIDPEDQERIFERFTQVDSSSSRKQGGTGLGLAITKDLIQLHGGTIRLQSQLGAGSSFIFTIPQALAPAGRLVVTKIA